MGPQGALLSVFVVVATVNAVNFVDGLDGLAAGVVAIGAVAFFVFAYKLADVNNETLAISAALLCAALGGACVGFLPHNFFPARIFMGDSGSMLIGLVLSASTVTLTGQFSPAQITDNPSSTAASFVPTLLPLLLPVSILIVPMLLGQARGLFSTGRTQEATEATDEAIDVARGSGNPQYVVWALWERGWVALATGDHARAQALAEEAAQLARVGAPAIAVLRGSLGVRLTERRGE